MIRRNCSIVAGALLALAMITPAAAAPPAPAWSCTPNPGDTFVTWRAYPGTTLVDIQWFDADGNVIASYSVVPGRGRPAYSQQTPAGATEVGFHFFDATGEFGVGGGMCL